MSLKHTTKIAISIIIRIIPRDVLDRKKTLISPKTVELHLASMSKERIKLRDYLPIGHMEAIIWSNPF